jgi:hypothetical protein
MRKVVSNKTGRGSIIGWGSKRSSKQGREDHIEGQSLLLFMQNSQEGKAFLVTTPKRAHAFLVFVLRVQCRFRIVSYWTCGLH